jgi:polyhydroxybutyrate depolymerase
MNDRPMKAGWCGLACLTLAVGGACGIGGSGAGGCRNVPIGTSRIMLRAGGATHAVRIDVPSAAGRFDVLPTVLNWHGLGDLVDDFVAYSGFETLAEKEDFIVVHPRGAVSPGLPVLESGRGWELVDFLDTPDRDDIAFARALIDDLIANWCADQDRIYSIGMSNGGLFTSSLVCGLSDRLAAAASIAGVYHPETCQPSEPLPYIAFHGTEDTAVPYEAGGYTVFPELRDNAIITAGVFDAFAAFARGAGCEAEPLESTVAVDVTRYDYRSCAGETPMSFYAIEGGGHTWPGEPGGPSNGDIDATEVSWAFFARQSRSGT